ncbi:hypothetical protein D8S78_06815 [Natrialba swarupiae]|nr:hypothetical protein [Natrialba swarupiae]
MSRVHRDANEYRSFAPGDARSSRWTGRHGERFEPGLGHSDGTRAVRDPIEPVDRTPSQRFYPERVYQ